MWRTCLGIRSLFLPRVADSLCYRLHCEDVLKNYYRLPGSAHPFTF